MRLRRRRTRPEPWVPEHEDEGYDGPAQLHVGDSTIEVDVVLAGHLEPLDGRYHWYGRVVQSDAVDAAKKDGATEIGLAIADGATSAGRLAEHDAWGNMRITGLGAPPFERPAVEVTFERS
ncbi:DUF4873 domain-containing protein [Aeromicrobium sp.]|uniref:DUF4873 domain-containing protein n=1 Tax=Aeromicrobium sp. TaxID=1871063 RepID=UPI003C421B07